MADELTKAYETVIYGSRIQPMDDELAILKKLLSQASINSTHKDSYIKGLEQLVLDLKNRIADLEKILGSQTDSETDG